MRTRTLKRAALDRQAMKVRKGLVEEIGHCELCGTRNDTLALHEVARGGVRVKAQTEPSAVLCLCNPTCHRIVERWKPAKQLALIKAVRETDFDLEAYNRLVNRRVTVGEVAAFRDEIELELGRYRPEFDCWA